MPDREKTVLFYSAVSYWGGAEQSLFLLMKELQRQGSRLMLAAPDDGPLHHAAREAGIAVQDVPSDAVIYKSPLAFRTLVKRLERLIARENPGILHANTFWAGRALSWAVHGPVWNRRHRMHPPIVVHLREFNADRATEVRATALAFPVDQYLAVADHIKASYSPLVSAPVRRIHNGVDPSVYDPDTVDRDAARATLGLAPEEFAVGLVGRMHPMKGHRTFLDACHLLRQEGLPVRAFLAGAPLTSVEEDYYASLKGWITANRYDEFTTRLGFVKDLTALYRALDVLAAPSQHSREAADIEALPAAVMEGMAMGLNVVASDYGGAREVIEDGASGFIVKAASAGALAARLEELFHDASMRERVGQTARRRILRDFTLERTAEEIRRLYRDLTGLSRKVEAGEAVS